MWIAGSVAESVMLAMDGHPGEKWALRRHRAEHSQDQSHPRTGIKTLVREMTMQPNRHSTHGQQVHEAKACDFYRTDTVAEGKVQREDGSDDGQSHYGKRETALQP